MYLIFKIATDLEQEDIESMSEKFETAIRDADSRILQQELISVSENYVPCYNIDGLIVEVDQS